MYTVVFEFTLHTQKHAHTQMNERKETRESSFFPKEKNRKKILLPEIYMYFFLVCS